MQAYAGAGRRVLLALACLLVGAGSLLAQDAPLDGSQEAVARAFFDALEEARWSDAAGLFHPDSLESWYRRAVRRVEITRPRPSPESLRNMAGPGLTGAAADSAMAALEEQFELSWRREIARRFAGVESMEGLEGLGAREAAARALRATSPGYYRDWVLERWMERMEAAGKDPEAADRTRLRADLESGIAYEQERIVEGVVRSGERAYVVYRLRWVDEASPDNPDFPAVLPMVRSEAGWRIAPRLEELLEEPGPELVTRLPSRTD